VCVYMCVWVCVCVGGGLGVSVCVCVCVCAWGVCVCVCVGGVSVCVCGEWVGVCGCAVGGTVLQGALAVRPRQHSKCTTHAHRNRSPYVLTNGDSPVSVRDYIYTIE